MASALIIFGGMVFAAMIEPFIAGKKFDPRELLFGVIAVPGLLMLVGGVPLALRAGIGMGVLSAFLTALFSALNKRYIERADPFTVTCVELGAGTLLLSLVAPVLTMSGLQPGPAYPWPSGQDAGLLLLLAVGCTLLPFILSLVALRHISAFSSQLALNLEPVYAILLAIVLLGEQRELTPMFYVGVGIILLAAFAHPLLSRKPVSLL